MLTRLSKLNQGPHAGKIPINRRDRKKLEAIARIKQAAFEVFAECGFADAKMTDIAERADVAPRTLFNYAVEKRDLLAFVMSDEFVAVSKELFPKEDWDTPIIDLVTGEMGRCLEILLRYFPISLMIFRESIWSDASKELKRIQSGGDHILLQLKKLIEYKQSKGAISRHCKAEDISWILFSLFMTNVRRWLLTDRPSLKMELLVLRRQWWIVLNGLSPAKGECKP